mmetsp:Transcript_147627/g.472261  ORF Transcript_147627/g.472261 Transcript_147627/m.472261 type:complete len:213 (+) Transcript_147627:353-991(+)
MHCCNAVFCWDLRLSSDCVLCVCFASGNTAPSDSHPTLSSSRWRIVSRTCSEPPTRLPCPRRHSSKGPAPASVQLPLGSEPSCGPRMWNRPRHRRDAGPSCTGRSPPSLPRHSCECFPTVPASPRHASAPGPSTRTPWCASPSRSGCPSCRSGRLPGRCSPVPRSRPPFSRSLMQVSRGWPRYPRADLQGLRHRCSPNPMWKVSLAAPRGPE